MKTHTRSNDEEDQALIDKYIANNGVITQLEKYATTENIVYIGGTRKKRKKEEK